MTQRHDGKRFFLLLAGACAISLTTSLHAADQPGTVRVFLQYLSSDGNGPDWEAEGSRRIVVRDPDANGFSLLFGSPDYVSSFPFNFQLNDGEGNLLLDLTSTTWVRSSVLHITDDGVQVVRQVYWLVNESEDPDELRQILTGLTAATGPDGDVLVIGDRFLDTVSGSTTQMLNNGGNPVRFSVGLFRK
jgi:hypothetical protein